MVFLVALLGQADSQLTLRDLRLQLAQQISLLAAERTDSSIKEKLFRGPGTSATVLGGQMQRWLRILDGLPAVSPLSDNRMESLLQKADQVLNHLSQGCGAAEPPAGPAERHSQPITPGFSPVDC